MAIQYILDEIKEFKGSFKLPLACEWCRCIFYRETKYIRSDLKRSKGAYKFCSKECANANRSNETNFTGPCVQCGDTVRRLLKEIKKSKNKNIFCSKNCAATYNNTHKTKGNRKSKLEKYLEEKLPILYPD